MKDWRFYLAEARGTLTALAIFIAMFTLYVANHPAGFTANVLAARTRRYFLSGSVFLILFCCTEMLLFSLGPAPFMPIWGLPRWPYRS